MDSNSWFIAIKKMLYKYELLDPITPMNNPPRKLEWKKSVFLPLIYPPELEVKETTDTASSASFLEFFLMGRYFFQFVEYCVVSTVETCRCIGILKMDNSCIWQLASLTSLC
jgi:hypothetical protein